MIPTPWWAYLYRSSSMGELKKHPFEIEKGWVYGSGCSDMHDAMLWHHGRCVSTELTHLLWCSELWTPVVVLALPALLVCCHCHLGGCWFGWCFFPFWTKTHGWEQLRCSQVHTMCICMWVSIVHLGLVVNSISKPPICIQINFIFTVLKPPTHTEKIFIKPTKLVAQSWSIALIGHNRRGYQRGTRPDQHASKYAPERTMGSTFMPHGHFFIFILSYFFYLSSETAYDFLIRTIWFITSLQKTLLGHQPHMIYPPL